MTSNRNEYWKEYQRKRKIRLGLSPPKNPTIGYKGEQIGLKVLIGAKKINRPCDLEWEGKLVDVKTGIKRHGNFIQWTTKELKESSTFIWKFYLKQLRKVDLFLIICQDREEKIEHIFLIPDKIIKTKNLSISENKINKYSQYRLSL